MGLLDGLMKAGIGQVLGGSGGGQQGQVIQALIEQFMGGDQDAGIQGLSDLVNMLKQNGLDDALSSWIGQGDNMSVDAEQIKQGFDSQVLDDVASKADMPKEDVASQLSDVLPGLIDKLTPNGQVDEQLGFDDALGLIGKLLK